MSGLKLSHVSNGAPCLTYYTTSGFVTCACLATMSGLISTFPCRAASSILYKAEYLPVLPRQHGKNECRNRMTIRARTMSRAEVAGIRSPTSTWECRDIPWGHVISLTETLVMAIPARELGLEQLKKKHNNDVIKVHCESKEMHTYRKVSNIRRTKSQNLNASRLIL